MVPSTPTSAQQLITDTNIVDIPPSSNGLQRVPPPILIDDGSADNFSQARLVNFLGLSISSSPSFQVLVRNGEHSTVTVCVKTYQ